MIRAKHFLLNGIRLLTLAACVITLGVSISRAQVRPPGGGPIRPGMVGGGPVMPNPPGGPIRPGMVGGGPVIPNPPGMPNPGGVPPGMPPPGMPNPGIQNPPGMPNPGMPNMNRPGVPGMQRWTCTKCGAFLADSVNEPVHIRNCPRCGVRFIDGAGGGGGGNFNPAPPPVLNQPVGNVGFGNPVNVAPGPGGNADPDVVPEQAAQAGRSIGFVLLVLGAGIVGLVVLGGGAVLGIFLMMNSSSSDKPRRRRGRG